MRRCLLLAIAALIAVGTSTRLLLSPKQWEQRGTGQPVLANVDELPKDYLQHFQVLGAQDISEAWHAHALRFLSTNTCSLNERACCQQRQCALLRSTSTMLLNNTHGPIKCPNADSTSSTVSADIVASSSSLATDKITGVMPTFKGDLPSLRQMLATCRTCLSDTAFQAIWLVVPASQLLHIFDELRPWLPPHWLFVTEEALLLSSHGSSQHGSWKDVAGWFKQQDIKLAIYAYSCTQFYMALDSDLVCTAVHAKWFQFTKPPYVIDSPGTKAQPGRHVSRAVNCLETGPAHPRFESRHKFWGVRSGNFENSATVLGLPLDVNKLTGAMGFTPQMMATLGMAEVARYFEARERVDSFLDFLLNAGPGRYRRCKRQRDGDRCERRPFYTEFFLYQLTLEVLGRWDAYHLSADELAAGRHCAGVEPPKLSRNADPYREIKEALRHVNGTSQPGAIPERLVVRCKSCTTPFMLVQDDLGTAPSWMSLWRQAPELGGRHARWNARMPRAIRFSASLGGEGMRARFSLLDELPFNAANAPHNQGGTTIRIAAGSCSTGNWRKEPAVANAPCVVVEVTLSLALPNGMLSSRGETRVLLRQLPHGVDTVGRSVRLAIEPVDPSVSKKLGKMLSLHAHMWDEVGDEERIRANASLEATAILRRRSGEDATRPHDKLPLSLVVLHNGKEEAWLSVKAPNSYARVGDLQMVPLQVPSERDRRLRGVQLWLRTRRIPINARMTTA